MLDDVRSKPSKVDFIPIVCEWKIIEQEPEFPFNTISEHSAFNLVVNTGRDMLMEFLFALTGAVPSSMVYMGVGASSVANDGVTTSPQVTDTHLYYELNGENRKTITNSSGSPLSTADIQAETITISGATFYKKIVVQAVWPSGSLNNNHTFMVYALFSTPSQPSTPSGVSGVMFNELFDPSPLPKSSGNQITAQMTLRF